ncbi:hypothetical protein [Dethiosulfovibrio salsuginis]|uniref:Uncharacterized protein n=1 Tax=Dethiosulfovibrio salsuginis TaxID=561720 RepID=A0A1X7K2X2_9BACT|nr:hypothetical protein [Dethiosulfovibrio salsuginis]SMG34927.1 hypothetical protein SAMN06275492_12016 [Dethiosulfovibrio salsuginis]
MFFRTITRGFYISLITLLWVSSSYATSLDISVPEGDQLSRMLYEVEIAGKSAEREIGKLPSLINEERLKIAEEMDLWAESELKALVEDHHRKVWQALEDTHLPDDLSTMAVWWEQLKAGVMAKEDLEQTVQVFLSRADRRVAQVSEPFQANMLRSLENRSQALLLQSMEEIRRPFLEVIRTNLPIYNHIPLPPVSGSVVSKMVAEKRGDLGRLSSAAVLGLGAILALMGSRIMKKLMAKVMVKVGGKVVSKVVPIIGWILLALEGFQMAQAKATLEEELRKAFFLEYKSSVTVQSIWFDSPDGNSPSLRQEMNRNVESMLSDWQRICHNEATNMIQSAQVLASSEKFRENVSRELDKGTNFQALSDRMKILWEVFGTLVADQSMEFFEAALLEAPDRGELRTLARSKGAKFVYLYGKYGKDYLEAVHKIGLENYLSADWSSTDLDWVLLNRRLSYLPDLKGNRTAAKGLWILVSNDAPVEGFSPASLSRIAAKEDLFLMLWRILAPDVQKVESFFRNDGVMEKVRFSMDKYPSVAPEFILSLGVEFWSTWSDRDIGSLLEIGEYRLKSGLSGKDIVVSLEDRASLIEVYQKAGEDGLELWHIYVVKGSGEIGRSEALNGVALLAKGYPLKDLKEKDGLHFALWCERIPFIGRYVFLMLKGLGWIPRFIILLGLPIGIGLYLWNRIRYLKRPPAVKVVEVEKKEK